MRQILYVEPGETGTAISRLVASAPASPARLAVLTNIGAEKLGELLNGATEPTRAERLRLLIVSRCSPRQIRLANRLLQAAGYYIVHVSEENEAISA